MTTEAKSVYDANRMNSNTNRLAVALTATLKPESMNRAGDSDVAEQLRWVQLRRVYFGIHHKPWFIGGLGHEFSGPRHRQWAEHSHQSRLRHTAVFPAESVIKTP
jgi:hypothetical protein